MEQRIVGEYAPPREIINIGHARLAGKGIVVVSPSGIRFDASMFGAEPKVPIWASIVLLLATIALSKAVPAAEGTLMAAAAIGMTGFLWLRFRGEVGKRGEWRVAWTEVEHVVRLASAPDVLAIVLGRGVAGWGTPEQVYFAPSAGVEALADLLRQEGPSELTIDLTSGLAPAPFVDED